MHYDVISCRALEYLVLEVAFRDGLSGRVQIQPSHLTGVFEKLKDPSVFFKANCNQGFVAWGEDLDLAPDAMYSAIRSHGSWVLS